MEMTKIQTPHTSERTSAEPGSEPGRARVEGHAMPDAVPAVVSGGRRIRYGYWLAAIAAGLALWAVIFAFLF